MDGRQGISYTVSLDLDHIGLGSWLEDLYDLTADPNKQRLFVCAHSIVLSHRKKKNRRKSEKERERQASGIKLPVHR